MFHNHNNRHITYGTDGYNRLTISVEVAGSEILWSLYCGEGDIIEESTTLLADAQDVYNQHFFGEELDAAVGDEIISKMFFIWGSVMRVIEGKGYMGSIAEYLRGCGEITPFLPHSSCPMAV